MSYGDQLDLLQDMRGPLTLGELEQHLWQAANILRGPIDQADFKSYIFPLLFFKRISDVYDEEFEEALRRSGGDHTFASYAENHRFQIPEGCSWDDVRRAERHVGSKLLGALNGIERANPNTLGGIFGDTPWTNKERVSESVITDLIEHFSRRSLANSLVAPDVLGQAYEYLIKRFADISNRKAGEFYTPRSVVKLLVSILDPMPKETVYDPACGTGGMLIEVVQHVTSAGHRPELLCGKLFGQEKNLTTAGIARMNLFLHSVEDFNIAHGDTLRSPAFYHRDELMTFDCVLANPPFSLKAWGDDTWAGDRFQRDLTGVPPWNSADFAWIQHMMASMAVGAGRVAVVLPQGVLFRGGTEGEIRRKILETGKVEAVVTLAPNLFYGAGLAACLLIIRDNNPHPGRVLFIDAADQFRRGRAQNLLDDVHVARILGWYQACADIPRRSRPADMREIARNGHSLNVSLYVESRANADLPELPDAARRLRSTYADLSCAEQRLREELAKWGL